MSETVAATYLGYRLTIGERAVTVADPAGRRIGDVTSVKQARLLVRGYRKERRAVSYELLTTCTNCFEPVPYGATRCECGQPLVVHPVTGRFFRESPHGCTCGGNNLCTACVLASFERDAA